MHAIINSRRASGQAVGSSTTQMNRQVHTRGDMYSYSSITMSAARPFQWPLQAQETLSYLQVAVQLVGADARGTPLEPRMRSQA